MKGHEAGNQPDDRDLAASSISQLIIFNSKVTECLNKKVQHIRHYTKNETPIAIYNGLKLQVKTRKRQLIDLQNKLDLSIPYHRVIQISSDYSLNAVNSALALASKCLSDHCFLKYDMKYQ